MFTQVGRAIDQFWPHLITLCGTIVLALMGTLWSEWSTPWTLVLIIAAASASAFGAIIAPFRAERRTSAIQSNVLAGIDITIIPLAERFISLPPSVNDVEWENAVTELTIQCRAFAQQEGTVTDANFYELGHRKLTRVNRASSNARSVFEWSRRRDPNSVEETTAIERIENRIDVICTNTNSRRQQKALRLSPGTRAYKAFASVPVVDRQGRVLGMLSLNSTKKNGITTLHSEYLKAVARLIAALHQRR